MSTYLVRNVTLECGHEVTDVPDTWDVGTDVLCFRDDHWKNGRNNLVSAVTVLTIDTDDGRRYEHNGCGIACYLVGPVLTWEDETYLEVDEDGNEYLVPTGEGEWIPDEGARRVRYVYVGDDTEHEADVADLRPLEDEDYCGGCGQVGCRAYG